MILLRKLRKEKKMTLKQLGDAVGRSEAAVCRWECCNRTPRLSTLEAVADVLGYKGNYAGLFKEVEE